MVQSQALIVPFVRATINADDSLVNYFKRTVPEADG